MSSENVKTEAVATEQEAVAAEETKTETAAEEETKTETAAEEETKTETAAEEETKTETAAAETEETKMADAAPQEEKVAVTEETAPAEAPAAEEAKAEEAAPAAEETKVEETAAAPVEDAAVEQAAAEAAPAPEAATAADQVEGAADDTDPAAAEPVEEMPPIPEGVMGLQTIMMGDKTPAPPSRLFYIDFYPKMLQAGDKKNKFHPKFEGYKQVFYNINQWLLNNPFKVMSVEHTLHAVDWDGTLEPDDTIFHTKEMAAANWLSCTRVWLMIKPKSDTSAPDSLAYYVHKPMPAGGVSEPEQLLNLPTTIDLLNVEIRKSIIPGRIISVQTVEHAVGADFAPSQMLSEDFGDDTYLPSSDRFRGVTLIKIIYAQGMPLDEEIGVADFSPDIMKTPSAGTGKVFFTPFSEILKRTNDWIAVNDAKTLRVVNVQIPTIRIIDITPKMAALKKAGNQVDTKAMWHMDSRNFFTSHLKFMRVFYVKLNTPEEREPLALTTKMFVAPRKDFHTGEPLSSLVGRTNAWMHLAGNSVFSAHLVNFEYAAAANTVDIEELCWLQDKKLRYFIQVVLLFLHGGYTEPAKKLLPISKFPVNPVDKSLKMETKPKSSTCTVL